MAKQIADVSTAELPISEPWEALEACFMICSKVDTGMHRLQAEYEAKQREMRELEAAGLVYAGVHYRDGKYLYLVFPSVDGEPRKREYIGADPEKVQAALAAIERGRLYAAAEKELSRLQTRARGLEHHLRVGLGFFSW